MIKQSVVNNWKNLLENSQRVSAELRKFDATKEFAPVAGLKPVMSEVEKLMTRIRVGNLSRLGKLTVARDVSFVFNSLNSLSSALKEKSISSDRIQQIVNASLEKMDNLTNEVVIHFEHRTNQAKAFEKFKPSNANVAELEQKAATAESYRSFNEAMGALLKSLNNEDDLDAQNIELKNSQIETQQRINPKPLAELAGINEVREKHLFESIGGEYADELREAKATLSKFKPSSNSLFVFLRLPIVLISSYQIPIRNLNNARISYRIIPFPGIYHGANAGGRLEKTDTFGVVLNSQLIAAIPNNISTFDKPKAVISPEGKKLVPRPSPQTSQGVGKDQESQALGPVNPDLIREQLPAIINLRTNRRYVDVLGESGFKVKTIVSKYLPGFQFIWLLPAYSYSKMGRLNMREIGFPFNS